MPRAIRLRHAEILLSVHQEMLAGAITPWKFLAKMKAATIAYGKTHQLSSVGKSGP